MSTTTAQAIPIALSITATRTHTTMDTTMGLPKACPHQQTHLRLVVHSNQTKQTSESEREVEAADVAFIA